jgi:CheY-like chemotaxis protein/PAS domain-containing protein
VHPDDLDAVSRKRVLEKYRGTITGDAGAPKLFDERRSGDRGTRNLEVRLIPKDTHAECVYAEVHSSAKWGPAVPDGKVACRYAEVHSSGKWRQVAPDGGRAFLGSMGIIHDVTERKRMAKSLEASQEAFQAIVARSTDGILIVDGERVVRYANPSAGDLLRRGASDLVGSEFGLPVVANSVTELDVPLKTGGPGIVEMRASESVWNKEKAYLVSLRNITDRKRLEADLEKAREVAEAANVAKSDFLARMSHDLRTPLNAIIGFSEGLLDRTDCHPLNGHQKARIGTILTSGRHLLMLINEILDIAKIESGRETVRLTTFDVNGLAESGKDALEALARSDCVDIILMDIMMLQMDGYATIAAVRHMPRFKGVPIIALTAKAMKGDREKCLEAGASDYIAKPVDADQLLSLLHGCLYR